MRLRFIDHSERISYCVLTEVRIICNEALTDKVREYDQQGIGWFGRLIVVDSLNQAVRADQDQTFVLDDTFDKTRTLHFADDRTGFEMEAQISSVRLGSDTGMDTLVDYGDHIKYVLEDLQREVTEADKMKLSQVFGHA